MKNYELTVILHPKHVDEGKQAFADITQKHGISIIEDQDWGVKKLAYPIDEQTEGFYLFKIVQAKPESVSDVMHEFLITQPILRSMFVVIEKEAKKKTEEKTEA